MPNCFVPKCSNGSGSRSATKKISLFQPPKGNDNEMLKKWNKAIPRQDRSLTYDDRVCEVHFADSDIIRYYETTLPDGTISKLLRGKAKLRDGAVPFKFPNCPAYLSKKEVEIRAEQNADNAVPLNSIPKKKRKISEIDAESEPLITTDVECEPVITPITQIPLKISTIDLSKLKLPHLWTYTKFSDGEVAFIHWSEDHSNMLHRLKLYDEKESEIYVLHKRILIEKYRTFTSVEHIIEALREIGNVKVCESPANVTTLKEEMLNNQAQCAKTEEQALQEALKIFPPAQQEGFMTCLQAAKRGTLENDVENNKENAPNNSQKKKRNENKMHGMRYTQSWLYHCIILRIKSATVYEHLRNSQLLALPSLTTIHRWLKNLEPTYGFQKSTFDLIEKKVETLLPEERRGVILLDEMKVTPYLHVDKKNFQVSGFTDLGKYTPAHQARKPGDHALVLLLQPFRGSWVQPIAAFLSCGAADGAVLTQILLEAVILLENANFKVDGIVSDGATWNRSMWSQYGATIENPFCTHFADESRKIYFFSDFPHLVKCIRNWVLQEKRFSTPDGTVDLADWHTLINADQSIHGTFGIKFCHRLTAAHLNPSNFEKMSVAMAYESTMKKLSEKENSPFQGSVSVQGTLKFITRIQNLIHAMSSSTPCGALRLNSPEYKVVSDFITYVKTWNDESEKTFWAAKSAAKEAKLKANLENKSLQFAKKAEQKERNESTQPEMKPKHEAKKTEKSTRISKSFLTNSTYDGLMVSLKNTLLLYNYLKNECNYGYLMTSRLNQDHLEKFFGMIRAHGGCQDHPTSLTFIQLYRLLSSYALIKHRRGSNVVNTEVMNTLIEIKKIKKDTPEGKAKWTSELDRLMEDGVDLSNHELFESNDEALEYFVGYVARKAKTFIDCLPCHAALQRNRNTEQKTNTYLHIRDKFGVLVHPSNKLMSICTALEEAILSECQALDDIDAEITFRVINNVINKKITVVGCNEHSLVLTKKIVNFYVITRMLFICKKANKEMKDAGKSKSLRKSAKVV